MRNMKYSTVKKAKRALAAFLIAAMALTSFSAVAEDYENDGNGSNGDYAELSEYGDNEDDSDDGEELDADATLDADVDPDVDSDATESDIDAPRDFDQVLRENAGMAGAGIMGGTARNDLYQHYIALHGNENRPMNEIVVNLAESIVATRPNEELDENPQYMIGDYEGRENLLIWGNDLGEFDFTFNVPETGLYHMQFSYRTLTAESARAKFAERYQWDLNAAIGMNNAIELGFRINGEYPFASSRNLQLDKLWQNEGTMNASGNFIPTRTIATDSRNHEMLPRQVQYHTWIDDTVIDREGLFNEPYFFFLEEGENTITLTGIKIDGVAFDTVTFLNFPSVPAYETPDVSAINATPALPRGEPIRLEGEWPRFRNSTELGPTYDSTSAGLSPYHPVKMRYNIVGGNESWQRPGQALTWEFEIPNDGYYRVSAKVRQNMLRGFNANRRVLVSSYDSETGEWSSPVVPVSEFENVQFLYAFRWYQQSFTTNNNDRDAEDVFLFFEAGMHRITLEVVPGDIGESLMRLNDEVLRLNYFYRRILMITGPDPDDFNPYHVDRQIPELLDEFQRIADVLRSEQEHLERLTRGGSEAAMLETMAVILDRCIANPDRIPQRLQSLRDNISSLSAWTRQAGRQPLQLDYIEIATVHEDFSNANPGFWRQLVFLWRGFIGSFFEDFTRLGDVEGEDINVWVGLGRDQALTLKHLVDSGFNEDNDHDIWISINLVQGGILEASLAGKGPDVGLFIGGDFPIQLAARGLLADLTQFDDYQQIVDERFAPELPIIFTYLDGVYALPITQVFPMMFYRTDILEDLGLEPPRDWEEYETAIAVLQRSFLGMGLLPPTTPPPMGMIITTFEPGDTFAILQMQTGQNFYARNDDGIYYRTTFNTPESIQAFTTWSRFYTVYQFEQSFDPFTRFRTGEMPIVVMPYVFFNQLNGAAPEIRGMWNFRHVPGTWREMREGETEDRFIDERIRVDADGVEHHEFLDISATSGASGGIIFDHLNHREQTAAWEFLKWLTSDDTQTQFGQNMEAMLGPLGRYDTANVNAMRNLAWSAVELNRLEKQRESLIEIPMIPANYAVIRHIRNAFRAVVNDDYFPRFALEAYNRDINSEITRKNNEIQSHQR
ncbi:MAG: extracellular solute-binding protein [Oscillospiraceae bacterium]|nr:extracellular solute-binding protein [Oscillospiraceae bacterium]